MSDISRPTIEAYLIPLSLIVNSLFSGDIDIADRIDERVYRYFYVRLGDIYIPARNHKLTPTSITFGLYPDCIRVLNKLLPIELKCEINICAFDCSPGLKYLAQTREEQDYVRYLLDYYANLNTKNPSYSPLQLVRSYPDTHDDHLKALKKYQEEQEFREYHRRRALEYTMPLDYSNILNPRMNAMMNAKAALGRPSNFHGGIIPYNLGIDPYKKEENNNDEVLIVRADKEVKQFNINIEL